MRWLALVIVAVGLIGCLEWWASAARLSVPAQAQPGSVDRIADVWHLADSGTAISSANDGIRRDSPFIASFVHEIDAQPIAGLRLRGPGGIEVTSDGAGNTSVPISGIWHYVHPDHGNGRVLLRDEVNAPYRVPRIGALNVHIIGRAVGASRLRAHPAMQSAMRERERDVRVEPDLIPEAPIDEALRSRLVLPFGCWRLDLVDSNVALQPAVHWVELREGTIELQIADVTAMLPMGRVLDPLNRAVVGAELRIQPSGDVLARTDAAGAFALSFDSLTSVAHSGGSLVLHVSAAGFEPVLTEPLPLGERDVVVRMCPTGSRWLSVVDDRGFLLADGWTAMCRKGERTVGPSSGDSFVMQPGGDGLAPLSPSTNARDWIEVTRNGEVRRFAFVELPMERSNAGGSVREVAQVVWARPARCEVRVLGSNGAPIPGCVVRVVETPNDVWTATHGPLATGAFEPNAIGLGVQAPVDQRAELQAGADGVAAIELGSVAATWFRIEPGQGFVPTAVRARPGRQDVVVAARGSLRGAVTGVAVGGRNDLRGDRWFLFLERHDGLLSPRIQTTELRAGRYSVEDLPHGRYGIEVQLLRAGVFTVCSRTEIEVFGDVERDVVLTRPTESEVRIQLVGLEDHADAVLQIARLRKASAPMTVTQNLLQSKGQPSIVMLPPGEYRVSAVVPLADGRQALVHAGGSLVCGEAVTEWEARFEFGPGELRVEGHDGRPLAMQWICVDRQARCLRRTDAQGTLRFEIWPGEPFFIEPVKLRSGVWQPVGVGVFVQPGERSVRMDIDRDVR